MELIRRVDELGGAEKAIAAGFFQEEIGRSAYEQQLRLEAGETTIVGVNRFTDDEPVPSVAAPDYAALEKSQVESVVALRKKRDAQAVGETLQALRDSSSENATELHLMPLIIDAVRARATVGEIAETLAATWGYYRPGA